MREALFTYHVLGKTLGTGILNINITAEGSYNVEGEIDIQASKSLQCTGSTVLSHRSKNREGNDFLSGEGLGEGANEGRL